MRLGFIGPALGRPSGGSTYNAEVLVHWPASLPRPASVELAGAWPEPDAAALSALRAALGRFDAAIVDGLVGAAQPGILAEATASGRRVLLLIHLPLADEGGLDEADRARLEALECASVRVAWRVVATSRSAATDVARRHGRPDVLTVAPGVNPAPVAPPHSPPHLLSIGAIGPLKNQLAVASALAACAHLDWRASLVGPVADPAYADAVAAALHACVGDFAPGFAVLAETDGGRPVAAVRSETGRWVAGNAFPDKACATAAGAERELTRLVKRGRRGLVAQI